MTGSLDGSVALVTGASSGIGEATALALAERTELRSHNRPEIQRLQEQRFAGKRTMDAADIADAILYVVTRPWHVAINEVLIRPTEQAD